MSDSAPRQFSLHDTFPCPVCRYGSLQALPMMEDAIACGFCQHLFTANVEQQVLKLADSQIPLSWQWHGRNWRGVPRPGMEVGWSYAFAGVAFVVFPTLLVGMMAYMFPAEPGSSLAWLPLAWTGLVLVAHLGCALWLLMEYYQFPVLAYLKATVRHWARRSRQLQS